MLNDPNISSPANIDAAVEYRDNFDSYKKKVRKLTIQSVESLWRPVLGIDDRLPEGASVVDINITHSL